MNAEPLKKEYGWKFEFRIRGKYFDKDDIKLFCNYTITDEAGDSYTGDKQCSVYYEPIDIKDFTINSNKENSKTFKNEDDITISFKTTHPVKAKCSIAEKLKNITITFSDVNRKNNKYEYTYTFKVKDGQFADNEEIKAKLIVNDAAKNAEEVISKESDIKYYAPIEETFKSLKCISSNDNAHYVIYKDSFTLIYESGHPVNIQNMVIGGKMVKCKSSKYGKKWEGTVKLKDLDLSDNSIIKYNFRVTDDAANTPKSYNQKNYPSVIYFAPIEINDLKMVTGNDNRNLAKTGDKLTLSFTTTHKIDIRNFQIKLSEFQNAEIVKNGEWERGKCCYEASYTVPEDNKYDDKRIGMSIMVGDAAGNSIVSVSEKDTPDTILYYKPIKMTVSNIVFESSNNYSTAAKNGDTLKVSFESSHPVSVEDSEIAGMPVKFSSSDGGYSWTGSVKAAENMLNDNSCIEYSMNICDDAGNENYSINQESTANIVYYAPLSVNGLSMESDNESGNIKIAKNNDNITVRFSTTHPVYISDSTIAGQKVNFISDDQMNWTAVYKVNDGDTDNMSAIAMNFIVNDLAGNTEVMVTHNGIDNVVYYAPVQVSDVKITTNNAKNANLYAKDGDTVTVEFSTNHQAHMINGMIAGQMADVSSFKVSDTDYRWQMNYTIKNGDISDSSNVGFEFSLDDEAHNNLSVNQDRVITQNAITYYAPFTADTEYSSDYKDGNYVKNGDTITVKCKATHPVSVVNALIAGRQALVQQNDSDEVLMIYTIPENEGAMPEGGISFEYTIEDKAGNELIINQISEQSVIKTIIYDRTLPQIKVTNDNTGGASFYSDTVKYSLEYTGTNIYEEGMSCVINGVESIGDFKRQPIEDGYRIDIELNAEENYLIKASCIDMAGNKDSGDASIAVTVDKTSPKLKIVNINTGHIFNSEFTLADYLDIDESNLRDIDCMLTDSEGSKDWDINSEVTGDGKKTVTLKMTDMAGNVSDTYVYEFYVDVTAPSPVIMDKDSGYMFKQGKNTKRFAKNMSLNISLDEINVGKEPDKFTSIKVLDEDGNEYM
ncbi:MAG: hypothetical protein K2I03_08330, partial [Lachnospiraceae bacterium]|nr:hypothetical protein [Lachnospiraceae bacterium]